MALACRSFPPSFLCIGAQKACTSWLNRVLKSDTNNGVFIPYLKETFFLNLLESQNPAYPLPAKDMHSTFYAMFKQKTVYQINEVIADVDHADEIQRWQADFLAYLYKSLSFFWTGLNGSWYEHLYSISLPDQILGDITPDYSLLQDGIISELSLLRSDLKIILMTRDPVERDLSQLKMQLLPQNLSPSEKECIEFLQQPHVLQRSEYKNIADRWIKYFGENSVLVLDVNDICNRPSFVLQSLSSFLGLELCVPDSVIAMRDNVNTISWKPPHSVRRYLEDYYHAHPVY